MKHFSILLIGLLFSASVSAQSPDLINYQAVARDVAGVPMVNQSISIRFGIYPTVNGSVMFEEVHAVQTDAYGLFTLKIGAGTPVVSTISAIDWTNGDKYLKVEMNVGNGYVSMGTYQMVSVPFAFASAKATEMQLSDLTDVTSAPPTNGQLLKFNGSLWAPTDDLSITSATTASGDLLGTYPSPTVRALRGVNVSQTLPSAGQVLKYNGSAWAPNADNNDIYTAGTGITVQGNIINSVWTSGTGKVYPATLTNNVGIGNNDPQFKLDVSEDIGVHGLTVGRGFGGLINNTVLGYQALQAATVQADGNTAIGYRSLYVEEYGENNTAVGSNTMLNSEYSNDNTAIGSNALLSIVGSSNENCAVGHHALESMPSGTGNTALGAYAGDVNQTLTHCTFVGADAYPTGSSLTNTMGLGYNARPTASNMIHIGNTSVTSIKGQVSFTTYSDQRFKKNVKEDVRGLDFILQLRPVTYNVAAHELAGFLGEDLSVEDDGSISMKTDETDRRSRDEKEQIRYSGFMAQEVEEAAKKLGFDFSGVDVPQNEESLYGLRYAEFVVPLVKAIQEQQVMIDELRMQNEKLTEGMNSLLKTASK
ncbi:MAG: tail fiber domain-containing protein [Flavobacteriales bacterium]|nr:tail fiber domain-containing protein [Flavobacteriales bacterium]